MWQCLECSHLPFSVLSLLPSFPIWRPCEGCTAMKKTLNKEGGSVTQVKIPVGLSGVTSGGGAAELGVSGGCGGSWWAKPRRGTPGKTGKWRQIWGFSFPPPVPEPPMPSCPHLHPPTHTPLCYYYWLFGSEWQEPLTLSPTLPAPIPGWERQRSCLVNSQLLHVREPQQLMAPGRLVLLLDLSLSDSRNTTHSSLCVFCSLPLRTHGQKLD